MTGTMCVSGAALVKAGKNVYSPFTTEIDDFIGEAEAFLCNLTKHDLITNWASLNAVYKLMFQEYCARSAAVEATAYDMSGYTSRVEAEDIINIHVFRMNEIVKILNDSSVQDFIGV